MWDLIATVLVCVRRGSRHSGSPWSSVTHLPIGQDPLRDLTHKDKEQDEGEDPAQVVPWEVQPGAMMNVHLGALAAPSCRRDAEEGRKAT